MEKTFSELVLKGNFPLVKGFLIGYLSGRGSDAQYFFCHGSGTIKRDTFTGTFRQFMELDSEIHVCLESGEIDGFREAIAKARPRIGIELLSMKTVTDAEFDYMCEIYNEEDGNICREIFREAQETLNVSGFTEQEVIDEKAMKDPLHKAHPYTYKSKGRLKGDFEKVMDVFLKLKRSEFRDFVKCGEVNVH